MTMSNISDFTGKFRAQKHASSAASAKGIRRPRESTVCRQCRSSKLRCDRDHPACGNCVKKGDAEECDYDHSVNRRAAQPRHNIAEDRLAHLESLVKELMHNQSASKTKYATTAPPITPGESPLDHSHSQDESPDADHADYVGFTHWSAVLDEIDGLKAELSNSHGSEEGETSHPSANTRSLREESIFGSSGNYPLKQVILDHLPLRYEADRLLSVYFQGENFILPFIHVYHFQSQYERFWSNTGSVNPLWLSILFSILHLSTLAKASTRITDLATEEVTADKDHFHAAAGQCLVIGKYYRPQEFVVEALVMYAHCKSVSSMDPLRETGAIHAMAVRSAYQLGYHRDPDLFKTFTIFEGEMRRRAWAVCKQLDLMTSFQLGLPSSICLENCDTKSLRNLSDDDFGPDSQELPASRPDDQVTRLLWFVLKDRQMPSFAKVCRDALSHREKSELEIQELDQEIRHMHGMIPDSFKTRPLSKSLCDAPFIIVTRIYLDFISLKSLCVLHRRYMAHGNVFSTVACLDAGKRIVGQFVEIYREFAPGGRLYAERWMLGCYTMNDFLLGTTVLCLYLHSRSKRTGEPIIDGEIQIKGVCNLLEQARSICVEKSSVSRDARRVARIVQLTLEKATGVDILLDASQSIFPEMSVGSTVYDPNLIKASFMSSQQNGDTQWDDDPFGLIQPLSFTDDGMADIDWAMFDPSILTQSI